MDESVTVVSSALADMELMIRGCDVLIIVPPFSDVDYMSLGPHVLQACAKEAGFSVRVLYANFLFAAMGYEDIHSAMGSSSSNRARMTPLDSLFGELLFAPSAYGLPPDAFCTAEHRRHFDSGWLGMDWSSIARTMSRIDDWVETLSRVIARCDIGVVGCTTMSQQTSAGIALLSRVKHLNPSVVTLIGGANCAGEMAEGIASLSQSIDHIFSGDSETTFLDFMSQLRHGDRPADRIIRGGANACLDAIPLHDSTEFYEQRTRFLPHLSTEHIGSRYEASRGCWWGEKHPCTFCGLSGPSHIYRTKSAERVISDLRELSSRYPNRHIVMMDHVIPPSYFKDLLPRLADELPNLRLYYQVRPNLKLPQMIMMKDAGFEGIMPGIEALSTSLLKRMNKGVTAAQNIRLLRYARSLGLPIYWGLLWGVPGDRLVEYEDTLRLLPLIVHLPPPRKTGYIVIERYSHYHCQPDGFGIHDLQPKEDYRLAYPDCADIERLATFFSAKYPSESLEHPEIIDAIDRELDVWHEAWQTADSKSPELSITQMSEDMLLLRDTRGLPGTQELQWCTVDEALILLNGRPVTSASEAQWAVDRKLLAELDGWLVPLATASQELLLRFESAQPTVSRSEYVEATSDPS